MVGGEVVQFPGVIIEAKETRDSHRMLAVLEATWNTFCLMHQEKIDHVLAKRIEVEFPDIIQAWIEHEKKALQDPQFDTLQAHVRDGLTAILNADLLDQYIAYMNTDWEKYKEQVKYRAVAQNRVADNTLG